MADLNYLANQILKVERRELILESALKCKTEKEKISFIENDFDRSDFGDGDDEGWDAGLYEYFEENKINDEHGEWEELFEKCLLPREKIVAWREAQIKNKADPFREELIKAFEYGDKRQEELMVEFKKEYPNALELIKNYKSYQFSCYFEEPDNFYKLFIKNDYEYIKGLEEELQEEDPDYKSKLEELLALKRKEK